MVDRTVTKWITFVSSEKYIPKEKPPYKEYWLPGTSDIGVVEFIKENASIKIKDKEYPAYLLIYRRGNGKKLGLVVPYDHPYYGLIVDPRVKETEKIKIECIQTSHDSFRWKKGAKIILITCMRGDENGR